MKCVRFAVFSLMLAASSMDAAELFRSTYGATALVVETLEWGETFSKVEPIEIDLSAVMRRGAPYALAESNVADTVDFPVDGITYTATKVFSRVKANGVVQWYGRIDGSELITHMSVVGEVMAAEIWPNLLSHRSIMFRGDRHYLVERDFRKEAEGLINDALDPVLLANSIPKQETTIASEYVGFGKRRAVRHPSNPDACNGETVYNTDYLAAYNDSALTKLGGSSSSRTVAMQARTENDETAINAALINTRGDSKYRVTLVATVRINYTEAAATGQPLTTDLFTVPELPEMKELRKLHKADNVMMFVGDSLGAAGASSLPGVGSSIEGYSVVGVLCSALTAIHEWGHQAYRMGHNPENWAPPDPVFAVDHYQDGVFYGVMAGSAANVNLMPHGGEVYPGYALASTYFKGVPTGIKDVRENGRMIEIMTPYTSYLEVSGSEVKCVQSSLATTQHIEQKSNNL